MMGGPFDLIVGQMEYLTDDECEKLIAVTKNYIKERKLNRFLGKCYMNVPSVGKGGIFQISKINSVNDDIIDCYIDFFFRAEDEIKITLQRNVKICIKDLDNHEMWFESFNALVNDMLLQCREQRKMLFEEGCLKRNKRLIESIEETMMTETLLKK